VVREIGIALSLALTFYNSLKYPTLNTHIVIDGMIAKESESIGHQREPFSTGVLNSSPSSGKYRNSAVRVVIIQNDHRESGALSRDDVGKTWGT